MPEREVFDSLPIWPASAWPVVYSSCLYALYQLNRNNQNLGIYYFHIYRGAGKIFVGFYWPAQIFDYAMHIYMIYVSGFWYVAVYAFIAAFGSVFAQLLIGFLPFAQYIVPIFCLFVAFLFLNLIGIVTFEFAEAINYQIYIILS